jgi:DNA-directed RNA polymerase specialized sigma24 family protein
MRDASQDYRDRRVKARSLAAQGLAVEEIAQKLDCPIGSIKRYLQASMAESNRQKHVEN